MTSRPPLRAILAAFRRPALFLSAPILLFFPACAGELSVTEPLPVADAGLDQILFLDGASSSVVDLDGTASCDPLGEAIASSTWTLIDQPAQGDGNGASIEASGLNASFTAEAAGEYTIMLSVKVGERASGVDYVTVVVREGSGDNVVPPPPATNACGQSG